MTLNKNTPQEFFGQTLQTVAGQAFAAAGYTLQHNPMHQSRGLFRYVKPLEGDVSVYVEFQLLFYEGGPSRFRVNLLRNTGADARASANYANRVDTTLSKLLWEDFGVRQFDSPDHWWVFGNPNQLGHALAEAARLVFGFGIPWLEGTLQPGQDG